MQYDGLRAELTRAERALQQMPGGINRIVSAQQPVLQAGRPSLLPPRPDMPSASVLTILPGLAMRCYARLCNMQRGFFVDHKQKQLVACQWLGF